MVYREKRKYKMRKRAESVEETKERITDSTVALHETLGPSRASISAIAKHAGVRRTTVYRHFPDESALFQACTAKWMSTHPPPDLSQWAAIRNTDERLRTGLRQIYTYYAGAEQMFSNILRDEETMPLVRQLFGGFRQYLAQAVETLMSGRKLAGSSARLARAACGHALAFPAWRSLAVEQGLDIEDTTELMCRLVDAASRSK